MIVWPEAIRDFDWRELHKKTFRIVVCEPNPECLEPYGDVYAQELATGKIYALHKWHYNEDKLTRIRDALTLADGKDSALYEAIRSILDE